ncbi:putative Glycosyl transferase group 1 [Candidatus Sulfotelmatobacter kueseliae]|uniref:Putative Glycosyl transferase group 1 n=1 Tax=Candidatus Sulfotelmatobacter kueseliae TaxID=2042962 RepID=A0A2U3L1S8_9BACT|nr:putative Glycosyl transferase group 1 [Candidatus Sulfotelmatobacter kueseliae]
MAPYCSHQIASPAFARPLPPPDVEEELRRVVHVVESLDRGSAEMWLLRMLRHARIREIGLDWTFYCTLQRPGSNDEEARALGAKVIHSPVPLGRTLAFVHALRQELRCGKYHVLHCHHDLVSAVYLLAAMGLPIRRRIVHVHNADEVVPTASLFKQRLYREPMRKLCMTMADRVVANSNHTLDIFLAGRSRRRAVDIVHYMGIDASRFERARGDRLAFRRELGLGEEALILLFAGRMVPEKNPVYAVDVLSQMRRLHPAVIGVFVGSGGLDGDVRKRVTELRLDTAVRYLGWRDDVPEIMCCSDWFILPHPEHPVEGFGFAIIEAQLAGLRMLLSRGILDDPLLPTASFRRLALAAGPEQWAHAAMELLSNQVPSRAAALDALRESPMNMDRALKGLLGLHT